MPTCVHVDPFGDWNAVNVLPDRSSRTHRGGVAVASLVLTDMPPVAERRWNDEPLPAETSMNPCAELAVSESRNITPALAHELVFVTLATCATMEPSPVSCCAT